MSKIDDATKQGKRPLISDLMQRFDQNFYNKFLAGHETTSVALTWLLYLLAKHESIQEKLFQEISIILQGRTPTYEDIAKLEYTLCAIKEGMRMYPPIALLPGRILSEDDTIMDYSIPKGTLVNVAVFCIHHNEKYWPNPFEFRPERFLHEESVKRPAHAYLPFGNYARTCLGNNFSLNEQRVFISLLLQKYKLRLVEPNKELEINPHAFVLQMKEDKGGIIFEQR